MSWLDQIKTKLTIQTGDGEKYTPEWINAKKAIEYKVAEFDFPDVAGSLIYRGTPKGTKYNVELYFQGSDHLNTSLQFQKSAADNRAWTLQHPFYGQLKVQPVALEFDNSALNTSKITGVVIETISQDYPVGAIQPQDIIAMDSVSSSQIFSTAAANSEIITKVPPANVSAKSVNNLKSNLTKFQKNVAKLVKQTTADFQDYNNTFNRAYSSVNNLISDASGTLNLIQAVIVKPAMFQQSVKSRFTLLTSQFEELERTITGTMSNLDKLLFTTNGGSSIAAMCLAASRPQAQDYNYSVDTLFVIEQLLKWNAQYIDDLDMIQTMNGGSITSFMPDHDALLSLDELLNFTVSNLFNIAVNGQQQRSVVLESDSNWILLTHRFYGLDAEDLNLLKLIGQNNAGLSTMLHIRKGTKINYYV